MNIADITPALVDVIISAFTFEPVLESSPGVYVTDSWPTYLTNNSTVNSTIFTLTPDTTMIAGNYHVIRATAEGQCPSICSTPYDKLVGQTI